MPAEPDSDENPSRRRVAGWTAEAASFGILGGLWALIVGIWARRRHRRSAQ